MFDESADVTSREFGRAVCLAFVVALIALAAISGTVSARRWQAMIKKDQNRWSTAYPTEPAGQWFS